VHEPLSRRRESLLYFIDIGALRHRLSRGPLEPADVAIYVFLASGASVPLFQLPPGTTAYEKDPT
jgi:hypothetical protein